MFGQLHWAFCGTCCGGTGLEPKRGSLGWRSKFESSEERGGDGAMGANGFSQGKWSLNSEGKTELRDTGEERAEE